MSYLDELNEQSGSNAEPVKAETANEEGTKKEDGASEVETAKPAKEAEQVKPDDDDELNPEKFGDHQWALNMSRKFKKQAREAQAKSEQQQKELDELRKKSAESKKEQEESEFLADPHAKAKELAEEIAANQLAEYKIQVSQQEVFNEIGEKEYGEFAEVWHELCEGNPGLQAEMIKQLKPAKWAYDYVQNQKVASKYEGMSVKDMEAAIRKQVEEELKGSNQEPSKPNITPVPAFVEQPSGGAGSPDVPQIKSLSELYGE